MKLVREGGLADRLLLRITLELAILACYRRLVLHGSLRENLLISGLATQGLRAFIAASRKSASSVKPYDLACSAAVCPS